MTASSDRRERAGELTVLMLDVDRFKDVNDGYRHDAGDRVLVGVARAIIHSVRPADFAARFGGDEFMVLLRPEPRHRPGPRESIAYGLSGHAVRRKAVSRSLQV